MKIGEIVQKKMDEDTEFQSSLANLSDADKATRIAAKRDELIEAEYATAAQEREQHKTTADNQKKRAEKAEQERDALKPPPTGDNAEKPLSYEEITALQGAKVHPDFVNSVKAAAKALNKSLVEALKDPIVKGQIERDNEQRTSAEVVDTTKTRPGAGAETDKEVLDRARGGNGQREIPAAGTEAAEKLYRARRANKFAQQSRR